MGSRNANLIEPGFSVRGIGRNGGITGLPVVIVGSTVIDRPGLRTEPGTPVADIQIDSMGVLVVRLHLAGIRLQQQIEVVQIGLGTHALEDRIGRGICVFRHLDLAPIQSVGGVIAEGCLSGERNRIHSRAEGRDDAAGNVPLKMAIAIGPVTFLVESVVQDDTDVHHARIGDGSIARPGHPDLIVPGIGGREIVAIGRIGTEIRIGDAAFRNGPRRITDLRDRILVAPPAVAPAGSGRIHFDIVVEIVGLGEHVRIHFQIDIEVIVIGRRLHGLDRLVFGAAFGERRNDRPVNAVCRSKAGLDPPGLDIEGRQDDYPVLGDVNLTDLRIAVQGCIRACIGKRKMVPGPQGPGGIREIEAGDAVFHVGIVGDAVLGAFVGRRRRPGHIRSLFVRFHRKGIEAVEFQVAGILENHFYLRGRGRDVAEGELHRTRKIREGERVVTVAPGEHGDGGFLVCILSGAKIAFRRDMEGNV